MANRAAAALGILWRQNAALMAGAGLTLIGEAMIARRWGLLWVFGPLLVATAVVQALRQADIEARTRAAAPPPPAPAPPPRADLLPHLNALDVEARRWLDKLARPDAGNFTSLALTWSREAERGLRSQGLSELAAILTPIIDQAHRDYAQPKADAEHIADVRLAVERVRERVRLAREGIEAQIVGR